MVSRTDMAILCRSSSSKPAFSAIWITSSSASSTLSSLDSSNRSTDSVAPLLFSAIFRVAATWPKRIVRINYRQYESQGAAIAAAARSGSVEASKRPERGSGQKPMQRDWSSRQRFFQRYSCLRNCHCRGAVQISQRLQEEVRLPDHQRVPRRVGPIVEKAVPLVLGG